MRTTVFPQEIQGELIQAAITQAVGTGLGLYNELGSFLCLSGGFVAFGKLFTQKYGLASSVMGGVIINDEATEEDVRNGVCLVNTKPGPYDELVIKYLYQPIYASSLQEEKETLIAGFVNIREIHIMLIYVISHVLILILVIVAEVWEMTI